MQIVPFEPRHLDQFESREGDVGEDITIGLEVWRRHQGVAWTLVDRSRVIACGGALVVRPGVGYPWLIIRRGAELPPVEFQRTVRLLAQKAINQLQLRSLETHIEVDNRRNVRWARRFGFRPADEIITDYRNRRYLKHVLDLEKENELCLG